MRRWVCIVTLLAGFTRADFVWAARLTRPVPIERLLLVEPGSGRPTEAWWLRS